MDLSLLDDVLRPELATAMRSEATFTPTRIVVPFPFLDQPGTLSILKCLFQPLQCPVCKSQRVIGHGISPRRTMNTQRYRCSSKSHKGGSIFFNEYTGTPLEDMSVSFSQWLAIRFWYWDHPEKLNHSRPRDERPRSAEIARRTGLSAMTVSRVIKAETSHTRRYMTSGPAYDVTRSPVRMLTNERRNWKKIYLKGRAAVPEPKEMSDLQLLILPKEEDHELSFQT